MRKMKQLKTASNGQALIKECRYYSSRAQVQIIFESQERSQLDRTICLQLVSFNQLYRYHVVTIVPMG